MAMSLYVQDTNANANAARGLRRLAYFYKGILSQTSLAKSRVSIPDFRIKEHVIIER